VFNDATDGGGIYAEGDSDIWIEDSTGRGVEVDSNTATSDGGGVYATGATTLVYLVSNARVNNNQAVNRGGGIYVDQQAKVRLDRNSPRCADSIRCTTLSGNSVTAGLFGAAGWADAGGTLEINQTYIEGNQIPAGSAIGSVLHATGSGAMLDLESVAFWDNHGPDTLMEGTVGATVLAAFVTASGNTFNSGTSAARPIALSASSPGYLYSSIFWPNSPVLQTGGALNIADCVIVSDPTGLPTSGLVTVVDPLFRNAPAGDLHLRVESPAVDHCDNLFYDPTEYDVDYEPHGYDLAENPNGAPGVTDGVYDIGFDEVWHFFYGGFESGDLSGWSSTSP
jgi:predicted outer membrane repeat protein